jgi:hypothetical protein
MLFNSLCNEHPKVFNIRSQQIGFDTIFTWEMPPHSASYRYLVAINGELVGVVAEGQNRFAHPTPTFVSSLDILAIPSSVSRFPNLYGSPYGRSVYLVWDRNTEPDLKGYYITCDELADFEATIDVVKLQPKMFVLPDSGTGSGRVSIYGQYSGARVNATYTVKINASGFSHNMSGSFSTPREFVKGQSLVLSGGIVVRFEDAREDYDTNDLFYFTVGPNSFYSYNGELADGSYTFNVRGFDNAQNYSSPLTQTIVIVGLPAAPTGISVTKDGATDLFFTWDLIASPNTVRIYSNFNTIFGTLEDSIIEENEWYESGAEDTEYTWTFPVSGVYKFYIRNYDPATGLESDDTTIYEIDTTALPNTIYLNVPTNVVVTPIANAEFRITWDYNLRNGGDLGKFLIYENGSFVSPVYTVVADTNSSSPIKSFELTASGYGHDDTVSFTIRAATSDENYETTNVDEYSGVADAAAPNPVTNLNGVPN